MAFRAVIFMFILDTASSRCGQGHGSDGEVVMALVKLERASKRFRGRVWAAREFDLRVKDREFLVPSACGKTITSRTIAGLELPAASLV